MTEPIVTAQTEALLAEFTRSGVRELHIRSGDVEIYLSNDPARSSAVTRRQHVSPSVFRHTQSALAPTAPATADPMVVAPPAPMASPDAIIVRAPNLGTFYGAPKPGAAAYVTVGSTVTAGAELCLIEVMKLFTAVRAEFDGTVEKILATDGEMVEAGQPLFAIVKH